MSATRSTALHPLEVTQLSNQTLGIIMGGGVGTRLYPLTKDRAKPAVPLAGKYRLVDIPISNCINSGLRNVYVLTQFNSVSLRAAPPYSGSRAAAVHRLRRPLRSHKTVWGLSELRRRGPEIEFRKL